jgi:transcriptional regulator with XRE-family HTH domain
MTTTAESPVLNFEERFTIALMRAGMNHRQFADHVGVTRKTVWTWQKEAVAPQVGALRVLAAEADVSYEWLIEGLGLPRLESNQQPAD